ncbi:LolA-related protein [Ideonella sp. DXS29W]|uniref:LolA-related protein n=1 Tax=Ideonella lacteola TaxID=2984193 RepID=A0ABU9BQW8_9BURK
MLSVVAMLAWVPAAQAIELAEVMEQLARTTSGEAKFVEQRHVQGLSKPLQSSGTLSFTAPHRFERRTLEPKPEAMIVDGNQVTLSRGGRSRQMTLDAVPEMALMVEAIRGTLNGDTAALRRSFKPIVSGSLAQWSVQLEPQDARLAAQLSYIQLSGRRGELRAVEVQMADGDRTLMSIEPVERTPAPK